MTKNCVYRKFGKLSAQIQLHYSHYLKYWLTKQSVLHIPVWSLIHPLLWEQWQLPSCLQHQLTKWSILAVVIVLNIMTDLWYVAYLGGSRHHKLCHVCSVHFHHKLSHCIHCPYCCLYYTLHHIMMYLMRYLSHRQVGHIFTIISNVTTMVKCVSHHNILWSVIVIWILLHHSGTVTIVTMVGITYCKYYWLVGHLK